MSRQVEIILPLHLPQVRVLHYEGELVVSARVWLVWEGGAAPRAGLAAAAEVDDEEDGEEEGKDVQLADHVQHHAGCVVGQYRGYYPLLIVLFFVCSIVLSNCIYAQKQQVGSSGGVNVRRPLGGQQETT